MFFTTFILLFIFIFTIFKGVHSIVDNEYSAEYSTFGLTPYVLRKTIGNLKNVPVPCEY